MAIFQAIVAKAVNDEKACKESFAIEILARWTIESDPDELGSKVRARLDKFNEQKLFPASHVFVWSPIDARSRWEMAA